MFGGQNETKRSSAASKATRRNVVQGQNRTRRKGSILNCYLYFPGSPLCRVQELTRSIDGSPPRRHPASRQSARSSICSSVPRYACLSELPMNAVAIQHAPSRGVYCRFCGKPIRLSTSFLRRETVIKDNESHSAEELSSRVFPARCRACHEEAIYALSQVVDFPEEDPARR